MKLIVRKAQWTHTYLQLMQRRAISQQQLSFFCLKRGQNDSYKKSGYIFHRNSRQPTHWWKIYNDGAIIMTSSQSSAVKKSDTPSQWRRVTFASSLKYRNPWTDLVEIGYISTKSTTPTPMPHVLAGADGVVHGDWWSLHARVLFYGHTFLFVERTCMVWYGILEFNVPLDTV